MATTIATRLAPGAGTPSVSSSHASPDAVVVAVLLVGVAHLGAVVLGVHHAVAVGIRLLVGAVTVGLVPVGAVPVVVGGRASGVGVLRMLLPPEAPQV